MQHVSGTFQSDTVEVPSLCCQKETQTKCLLSASKMLPLERGRVCEQ